MPFNTQNQYTANHKAWDHVGNIIPDVCHSEGGRPHAELKPAAWLPVQFFEKHYETWKVVMPGKVLALDPDGRAMPAHYGLTSASVVYAQSDVDNGVIDVATGLPVTTPKTVVLANLTGVRDATWTRDNAGTGSVTSGFLGRFGVAFGDAAVKYPIGVAPYAYDQWAGDLSYDGFNPATFRQHNHILQHQVAALCDYVIKLPLVPAQTANEVLDKSLTGAPLEFLAGNAYSRTNIQANDRYNPAYGTLPVKNSDHVIAYALTYGKLAKQTIRTVLALSSSNASDDLSGILVNERPAIAAVLQAGDYFVDYEMGVLFLYEENGDALPAALSGAAGNPRLTYYRYGAAAGVTSKFASVIGGAALVKPGDFLKCGPDANLIPIDGSEDFKEIVGQVLAVQDHPRSSLDKVRTAYDPPIQTNSAGSMANAQAGSLSVNAGQMDQMPGTATGGVTDQIHYAGAADKLVIINLVSR